MRIAAPAAMADDKTELAQDRTDLAEDRTILANERTFAGWMRTGFASVGVGLGFQALFAQMQPAWIPKLIATAFLVVAMAIFIAAERRACWIIGRLSTHKVETVRTRNLRILTFAVLTAIAALIAALWLVKMKPAG
jgi:putative membrane protein